MIFRENSGKNFTNVSNKLLQNRNLSYRARGIAVYLLSKHEDWETSIEDLKNNSPKEGRDSVRAGLQELADEGFATLNKIREVGTGKMLGERWFVSDNTEWVERIASRPAIWVVMENGRYRMANSADDIEVPAEDLPASGFSDAGFAGDRENPHNKEKKEQKKEKNKEKNIPGWSLKASGWWYGKLKKAGLLTRAMLRKDWDQLIEEGAIILEQIHRLDNYTPTEIGRTLEWLIETKDYVNGSGSPDKGGFWFSLNNFGSLNTFRGKKRGSESTKFDWMFAGWQRDQKEKPKQNVDNFQRG